MQLPKINLVLDLNNVQVLLNVLGELPNKSGTYSMMIDIKQQTEGQVNGNDSPPLPVG